MGKITCRACGGDKGKWVEKQAKMPWDPKKGTTKRVWQKCKPCGGKGKVNG